MICGCTKPLGGGLKAGRTGWPERKLLALSDCPLAYLPIWRAVDTRDRGMRIAVKGGRLFAKSVKI